MICKVMLHLQHLQLVAKIKSTLTSSVGLFVFVCYFGSASSCINSCAVLEHLAPLPHRCTEDLRVLRFLINLNGMGSWVALFCSLSPLFWSLMLPILWLFDGHCHQHASVLASFEDLYSLFILHLLCLCNYYWISRIDINRMCSA